MNRYNRSETTPAKCFNTPIVGAILGQTEMTGVLLKS